MGTFYLSKFRRGVPFTLQLYTGIVFYDQDTPIYTRTDINFRSKIVMVYSLLCIADAMMTNLNDKSKMVQFNLHAIFVRIEEHRNGDKYRTVMKCFTNINVTSVVHLVMTFC